MIRGKLGLGVLLGLLSACQPLALDVTVVPPAQPPAARATATPMPAAVKLQRAEGHVGTLTGTVMIDASYAVAHGGTIVTTGAGTAIAPGPAHVEAGDVVVGNDGVLASGSGNVVARPAVGGSATPQAVAAGPERLLPAVGMRLQAWSLEDGKPIPLGADGVTEVYTNAQGGFELYLPGETSRLVRLVASGGNDLTYEWLTPPTGAGQVIDEDSSLAARTIRQAFEVRLRLAATEPNAAFPPYVVAELPLDVFAGVKEIPTEKAAAAADVLLAYTNLALVQPAPDISGYDGTSRAALREVVDVLKEAREAAAAKLQADPHFLALPPFQNVGRPVDFAAAVLNYHSGDADLAARQHALEPYFQALGVPTTEASRLVAALAGIDTALAYTLAVNASARAAAAKR